MTKCSRCDRSGHNRRACPTRKRKAPTGAGAGEDTPSAGDRNAKRLCGGGGGRAEAAAALKGEEAPEEDDRLPPSGRLAFVNAVQPEFARDFLLPCLSDDVGALLALVHTLVVRQQLPRLALLTHDTCVPTVARRPHSALAGASLGVAWGFSRVVQQECAAPRAGIAGIARLSMRSRECAANIALTCAAGFRHVARQAGRWRSGGEGKTPPSLPKRSMRVPRPADLSFTPAKRSATWAG